MIGIGNKGISDLRLGSKSVSAAYLGVNKVWPSDSSAVAVTGISLDKTSLSLTVGNAEQITATVKPDDATDKSVFWVSMDEHIATVDQSGNVTAVGAGTTTVHAVATSNQDIYATCQVTAVAATVAVTGVSLSKTSLSLVEGGSETLLATVSPANATNKSVTWSSSNDSVATVDASGKVTAVKAGTATITVRTVDGGKTATCNLTVTAAISIVDFILTDGACYIPLLNVKPKQDMVIVSSFYVGRDPGDRRIFYGTENGVIQMFVNVSGQQRRISSYGYMKGGRRNISYEARPTEPMYYLLKQDFSGTQNYTAYYSNGGSPYPSSELDNYQVNNPNTRFYYGYADDAAFPSDQCLSVFGRHDDAAGALVAGSRFYGMKIWSGGNLVHDLVPAKKAAEYGIYDTVTQDFYANAGTGTLHGPM